MEKQGKQRKIFKTKIQQRSNCIDKERNFKYAKMKYCSYQYAETRKEN